MRGGLTLERGVHRQHHLVDAAGGDTRRTSWSMVRSSGRTPVQRGQSAAEHVIAAGEQPRPVERPKIGDLLDHAQRLLVAARIAADAHGSEVSTLPQTEQVDELVGDVPGARASSGSSAVSRFFIRCSTARRAERGPSPGRRASAWRQCFDFLRCH